MENKETILNLIKNFTFKKKNILIDINTELYSAGIFDSLEMLELVLFLENKHFVIKNKTNHLMFIMDRINTPKQIIELLGL